MNRGKSVDEYKLSSRINKVIVDGVLKGYLEYLEERKVKKDDMNVSGAYAWTRGNHIDHQISEIGLENGLRFKNEKAGYSWEYLEFLLEGSGEPFIIIVKNSRPMAKSFNGNPVGSQNNYLTEYAQINKPIFDDDSIHFEGMNEQIELELNNPEEIKAVSTRTSLRAKVGHSRFYIVTYKINEVTKLIDSIKLTLPNSTSMQLVPVEDLTYLIEQSEYEITVEDVEPIKEEVGTGALFSGDFSDMYDIPDEEKEANELNN